MNVTFDSEWCIGNTEIEIIGLDYSRTKIKIKQDVQMISKREIEDKAEKKIPRIEFNDENIRLDDEDLNNN